MNWVGFLLSCHLPGGTEDHQDISVKTLGVPADILTENLRNANLDGCR